MCRSASRAFRYALTPFITPLILCGIFWRTAIAQTSSPATPPASFEVASVRLASPVTPEEMVRGAGKSPVSAFPTNLFTARKLTLPLLVSMAYGVDSRYILNSPDWFDTQNYDVEARVEGGQKLTYDEMKPLLQHLLEERFGLVTHWTTKPSEGYELVVAKNGPKLVKSKVQVAFGGYLLTNGMDFRDCSMICLAGMLTHPIGYPVVDKTGISGTYDIKMSYAPANKPDSNLPDIFTALQEQLGLKLERAKVPVQYLVIDHVNRTPAEN